MKFEKFYGKIFLSIMVTGCIQVQASESASSIYVGAYLGQSRYDGSSELDGNTLPWSPPKLDINAHGDAYKFTIGYQPSQYWALEFGYVEFGTAKGDEFSSSRTGLTDQWNEVGSYSLKGKTSLSSEGETIAILGILPFRENLNIFMKTGLYYWDLSARSVWNAETFFRGEPSESVCFCEEDYLQVFDGRNSYVEESTGHDIFYGMGLSYNIGRASVVVEYENYKLDDIDVGLLSAGARYHF